MDALFTKILTLYANWKINPTKQEKQSYNNTDKVLLTFDDFTTASQLGQFLKILQDQHVRAVFFLVGDWTSQNPELVEKIKQAGHWVGNHTKTHANLLKLSDKKIREEIAGGPSSTLFRPPYGKYNKKIRQIAQEMGYKICYWEIDTSDWQGISKEEISYRATRSLHPGACILMHLNGIHTLEALPLLIREIRDKGYELCHTGKEIVYE